MISTKTKLVSAIAMLLVATIMMTSASFAWFTISTAPEVTGMDVSLAATKNLEIAKIDGDDEPDEPYPGDADDQTKWGAIVTFDDDDAVVLAFPATMTDGALHSVDYAEDGRIDAYAETTLGDFSEGVAVYTADIDAGDAEVSVTVGAVYGVWLRSNETINCAVSLSAFTVKDGNGNVMYADDADEKARLASAASVSLLVATDAEDTPEDEGTEFAMTANTAYRVYVTVYFDGEYLYAKDVAKGLQIADLELTFESKDPDKVLGTKLGSEFEPLMEF